MYQVTEMYRGRVIVARRPPYPRAGGGRFELDRCSQRDLKYLYDTLALTDAVEYVEDPEPEQAADETSEEPETKPAVRRRTRRPAAE